MNIKGYLPELDGGSILPTQTEKTTPEFPDVFFCQINRFCGLFRNFLSHFAQKSLVTPKMYSKRSLLRITLDGGQAQAGATVFKGKLL